MSLPYSFPRYRTVDEYRDAILSGKTLHGLKMNPDGSFTRATPEELQALVDNAMQIVYGSGVLNPGYTRPADSVLNDLIMPQEEEGNPQQDLAPSSIIGVSNNGDAAGGEGSDGDTAEPQAQAQAEPVPTVPE